MAARVVDASVAMKWVVSEPDSGEADRLLADPVRAPELLICETANVLWRRARRGDMSDVDATRSLDRLMGLPIDFTPDRILARRALEIAKELAHPVCDCLYLALAIELDIAVVTADRRFHRAASARRSYAPNVVLLGAAA